MKKLAVLVAGVAILISTYLTLGRLAVKEKQPSPRREVQELPLRLDPMALFSTCGQPTIKGLAVNTGDEELVGLHGYSLGGSEQGIVLKLGMRTAPGSSKKSTHLVGLYKINDPWPNPPRTISLAEAVRLLPCISGALVLTQTAYPEKK